MARFRLYRGARVLIALLRVLPRYLLLIARERWAVTRAAPEAWDRAHATAARQIRRLALDLGGGFTKAAQIGGARADILPAPFIQELAQFHDAVPPRPFESLAGIVARDLPGGIDTVFAWLDPMPLAAASLAQVHRGTLRDGSPVVIKIRYPEIPRIIPLDLAMLRAVARGVQFLQRRLDVISLVTEVTRFVELELDFRREVRSAERLAGLLADHPDVRVPRVYRETCGDDVIVLEYLEGIQVSRIAELEAAGHPPARVARRIGGLYGAMIFEHGFFQGDPHPGNLLVLPDGRIGLLDYGLCKELPRGFARDVAVLMVSSLIGDGEAALEAAGRLGFETGGIRAERLRSLLLSVIGDSDGRGVGEVLGESRLPRIPGDFALVVRTLILLNGLSHRLAPGRRLIQAELIQHLAAGFRASDAPCS